MSVRFERFITCDGCGKQLQDGSFKTFVLAYMEESQEYSYAQLDICSVECAAQLVTLKYHDNTLFFDRRWPDDWKK